MNRRDFVRAGVGAAIAPRLVRWHGLMPAPRPAPSAAQLLWQRDELALFHHFGVNTFTNREWGDGTEDPAIFNPARFDARQWASAARSAGARAMILTAKHHDGFCLWPTRTTKHSVAASPWRGGQGDVVRDFVDAARAEGLRPGSQGSDRGRSSRTGRPFSRVREPAAIPHRQLIHIPIWVPADSGTSFQRRTRRTRRD